MKESEKRLAEAQKIAHVGNWDWDLITDELYWSDEMYRIFGLILRNEVQSYNEFLTYIHPDDRDYVDNAVKRVLNGEPLSN